MLTGISVAIIGGDARQLEVIDQLSDLDASVTLVGFDELKSERKGLIRSELHRELCKNLDVLILPVIGTDDVGQVGTLFSNQQIIIKEEHIEALPQHVKIYTGLAKPYLKSLAHTHHIEVIELFDRDDVAIYNSIPTAEGAIMMAIQHTDITIHRSTCIVLGMGRTGMTLARLLQALGAQVKVGVREAADYARAWEMNLQPFYITSLYDEANKIDLLFNTIPTMIVTAQIIAHIPLHAIIIDLASHPGGTDFRYAEKRGIKAMLAPGLPGIVAPKTAGRIIATTISRLIHEDFIYRGTAL